MILRTALAVLLALLRCWPILLPPVLLTAIAAGTEQGRDAIRATASLAAIGGLGLQAYMAQAVTTVLATLAALILLAPERTRSPAWAYAAHFVPGLVGLLAGYIPLFMFSRLGVGEGGAWLWMAISGLAQPAIMLMARDVLPRLSGGDADLGPATLPLLGLGTAIGLAFIVGNAALLLFVVTILGLAVADRWLTRAVQPDRLWIQRGLLILAALVAIGGGILTARDPAWWGATMGSYATLIVALNAWLGFGILVWRLGTGYGVLGGVATLVLAFLFLTGPFGLGDVRLLPAPPREPATLSAHAADWLAARRPEIEASTAPYPVFLVTADGGGIRAAWWSATLLGQVQDGAPGFARHVFAMSGVSGGSLGVATFAAQLADRAAGATACTDRGWSNCAAAALGSDLLAPALAGMLTVDAPRTVLRTRWLPDRAVAQEQGFEAAWRGAAGGDRFAAPFAGLWDGPARLDIPLLLLNTTEATTGRRLVLAPVVTGPADGERADVAPLLGARDVRLSTAVLLSARFPGVSPAGWLAAPGSDRGYALVDGGFADNSGARSAAETLAALLRAADTAGLRGRIRPVALMISNDPVAATPPPDVPPPGRRAEISTLGTLLAPVATLDRLRQANTRRAKEALAEAVCAASGVVLDRFDLQAGPTAFPLGWMLAQETRDAMAGQQADEAGEVHRSVRTAMQLVRDPPAAIACDGVTTPPSPATPPP